MTVQKKTIKNNQIRNEIFKEFNFLKTMFSAVMIPSQKKNESEMDIENILNDSKNHSGKQVIERASNIMELEEKLEKMKSQNNFNLKNKLVKKSLTSKLNKKIKKKERMKLNKHKVEAIVAATEHDTKLKSKMNAAKPIFNTDGKLVFSKFDFAKLGEKGRGTKTKKDPKKILDSLQQQEEKFQKLAETDTNKAKELKEKLAWKNILQKAEGEKVKDDPNLLKKSIKKMEQKKKVSKKKWENRNQSVEQKKEERQKKRKENISKKKKEKKAKVVKTAVKRGRVVI